MYRYRVHFSSPDETTVGMAAQLPYEVESAEPYEVGSRIEIRGKAWIVTQAAMVDQNLGDFADISVWPAE